MSKRVKKIILIVFVLLTLPFFNHFVVYGDVTPTPSDSPTPTPVDSSQQLQDLQNKIKDLESKISDLHSQEDSLSSQIKVMDSQIKLTELRINATQEQMAVLSKDINSATMRINNLEGSLNQTTKVLVNRIVATYQIGSIEPMQLLLESNDINNFLSRANYLRLIQDHDKQLLYDMQQSRNDYQNQKNIFENQKKQMEVLQQQLQAYTDQLDQEKKNKQDLLTQTQGNEENYQKLLAQTEAQLASFSNFVTAQGGASLLSGQTMCDDWGCYYNQRDSQWGGIALNGTQYSIASDGCLMTSMAMVYTHYGHKDVTPLSINSVSSNFSGIPAALLKFSITANGVSSERVSADIDATLASGNPVIVGISYDGGPYPDHFVVFVGGSGGSYTMNDPFTPNGHNISFRGRYPSVRIVESDKVVF